MAAAALSMRVRSETMRLHVCLNVCAAGLIGLAACLVEANVGHPRVAPEASPSRLAEAPRFAPGTSVPVRIGDLVSSESARRGDPWRGITLRQIASLDGDLVPSGSAVSGIVSEVHSARGARAALGLRVITIAARGRRAPIRASLVPRVAIDGARGLGRAKIASSKTLRERRATGWTTGPTGVTLAAAPGEPIVFREGTEVTFRIR
jgi:hypothetical protein